MGVYPFIGGPAHGKRLEVREDVNRWTVAAPRPVDFFASDAAAASVFGERVDYFKERFRLKNGREYSVFLDERVTQAPFSVALGLLGIVDAIQAQDQEGYENLMKRWKDEIEPSYVRKETEP